MRQITFLLVVAAVILASCSRGADTSAPSSGDERAAKSPSDIQVTYYYRVIPVDSEGVEGAASNITQAIVGGSDTTPPVWTSDVGVTLVADSPGGVTVYWGVATDADSPPVTYNVYWQAGASLDWLSATRIADVTSPYPISGISAGTAITVGVRAQDAAIPANEETNTTTITHTVAVPADTTAPHWDSEIGLVSAVQNGGVITLSWAP